MTVTGGSITGGKIDLATGTAITSLTSQSTGANGNGGNVILAAFSGTAPSSGTITLPTAVTLQAGGNGAGSNGNVQLIAGATGGTSATIGTINTSGGAAGTGNISIATATPSISGGGACAPCVQIVNGAITAGTLAAGAAQTATVSGGSGLTAGGTVTIGKNTTFSSTGLSVSASGLTFGANSTIAAGSFFTINGINGALTLTMPDSSAATVSAVSIGGGSSLTFSKSAGAGTTTLNLNTTASFGPFITPTSMVIDTGVIATNSDFEVRMSGNTTSFTNNGTITSSGPSAAIAIQSIGTISLAGIPEAAISTTGGGSPTITVSLGGSNILTISNAYTFNPGAKGTVKFLATDANASITPAGGVVNVLGGGDLLLSSPHLSFNPSTGFSANKITVDSGGGPNPLSIIGAAGATAGLTASATGSISIAPTSGQLLSIGGVGATTITLDGAPVTITVNNAAFNHNGLYKQRTHHQP